MENKNVIYNDDVERIVNDPERQNAIERKWTKRIEKRQNKIAIDAYVFLAFSLAFGLLGAIGWMIGLLAYPVSICCGMYAAFCFGRLIENGKAFGWF